MTTLGGNDNGKQTKQNVIVCKWVLRKRVAVSRRQEMHHDNDDDTNANHNNNGNQDHVNQNNRNNDTIGEHQRGNTNKNNNMNHESNITTVTTKKNQYVGNSDDSDAQQEANWRWLARRKAAAFVPHLHDTNIDHNTSSSTTTASSTSVMGFPLTLGQVKNIMPQVDGTMTLAMVMIEQLGLPQQSQRGRLSFSSSSSITTTTQSPAVHDILELTPKQRFKVPIEQLVIASRSILYDKDNNNMDRQQPMIRTVYSTARNSWRPKETEEVKLEDANTVGTTRTTVDEDDDNDANILVCHRCGIEGTEMLKDHIASTPSAISCIDCLRVAKQTFGTSGTFLKSCRCHFCRDHHAHYLSMAFHRNTSGSIRATKATMTTTVYHNNNNQSYRNHHHDTSAQNQLLCNLCCLRCKSGISCSVCGVRMHKRCAKWIKFIESLKENSEESTTQGSRDTSICRQCCRPNNTRHHDITDDTNDDEQSDIFSSACKAISVMRFTDFDLPENYNNLHRFEQSEDKPITIRMPNKYTRKTVLRKNKIKYPRKKRPSSLVPTSSLMSDKHQTKKRKKNVNDTKNDTENLTETKSNKTCVFKPKCSRLLPYDPIQRRFEGVSKHQIASSGVISSSSLHGDVIRNLRSIGAPPKQEQTKTAHRAFRANQRRMMKDVVALGSSSLSLDALAGRESHLRFDRSGIHAWGVFADQDIREGELIVEYRGVIIGNAMAEKREKEYEQAKIGSDYMFRIDANSVCDATKHGNVARFINASCDPNCYTQIISISAVKRIVIYAKKDIQAGQELCYDYKFPLEFNEAKRIPCHCGAKDCRGFMNWDKRYVAIPPPVPLQLTASNDQRHRALSLKAAATTAVVVDNFTSSSGS